MLILHMFKASYITETLYGYLSPHVFPSVVICKILGNNNRAKKQPYKSFGSVFFSKFWHRATRATHGAIVPFSTFYTLIKLHSFIHGTNKPHRMHVTLETDTDPNTDTDPQRHASWVMGHGS